jgi:hypothetical protein
MPASPHPKVLPSAESGLTESEMQRFRRDFAGLDIPWLEREFREWVVGRDPPKDYTAALYGFNETQKGGNGITGGVAGD